MGAASHLAAWPQHSLLDQARQLLADRYGIVHGTFQLEPESHIGCRDVSW